MLDETYIRRVLQYSCVIFPPAFSISAMALSIIDGGVLSANVTTTGFWAGLTAKTTAISTETNRNGKRMVMTRAALEVMPEESEGVLLVVM
jgi:hypothetical protein